MEDDLICALSSIEYLCFLTTIRLSFRIDCSAHCITKTETCICFCSVHVQQLPHWRSFSVGGSRTLCLFNWATCSKRLRAPATNRTPPFSLLWGVHRLLCRHSFPPLSWNHIQRGKDIFSPCGKWIKTRRCPPELVTVAPPSGGTSTRCNLIRAVFGRSPRRECSAQTKICCWTARSPSVPGEYVAHLARRGRHRRWRRGGLNRCGKKSARPQATQTWKRRNVIFLYSPVLCRN